MPAGEKSTVRKKPTTDRRNDPFASNASGGKTIATTVQSIRSRVLSCPGWGLRKTPIAVMMPIKTAPIPIRSMGNCDLSRGKERVFGADLALFYTLYIARFPDLSRERPLSKWDTAEKPARALPDGNLVRSAVR